MSLEELGWTPEAIDRYARRWAEILANIQANEVLNATVRRRALGLGAVQALENTDHRLKDA